MSGPGPCLRSTHGSTKAGITFFAVTTMYWCLLDAVTDDNDVDGNASTMRLGGLRRSPVRPRSSSG